jgi:hypothetical protein
MKSTSQYNAELRSRLQKLGERYQQIELARRTGVPAPNVHRYLRAGKIPAEFCLALVEAFDLSPEWLVKGEGAPVTSDVQSAAAEKAGELLELVKAMNAVARMRLGAVVGDRDRKKLRELSDTLETYDRLRERMNDKSRPVLEQLLNDLSSALSEYDMPRARVLRETALELSRLCTDDRLQERLDTLQSTVEYMSGHLEESLAFERRIFSRRVRDGSLDEPGSIASCLNMVMSLRDTGRIREAQRTTGAILALLGEDAHPTPELLDLRMFMGNFKVELGDMTGGLAIMQSTYPLISAERRNVGTILLSRGLLLAGLMNYHEVLHFGSRVAGRSRLLLRFACFREDRELLKHATSELVGQRADCVPPEEYDAERARLLLKALGGKGKISEFDKMVGAHPPPVPVPAVLRLILAVHRGQYARLIGDRKALRSQATETQRAFKTLPAELLPRCEFKVLHLRNLVALGRAKSSAAQADAIRTELEDWVARGYRGLLPLA